MSKSKHIIVLNGHHYNSKTGERLSHAGTPAHDRAPEPEASHPTPVPKAAHPVSQTIHAPAHKPVRQHAAKHVAPHQPKPARTLMRQTVKKPSASLKRRIRVQGHLDTQIKQPVVGPPVRAAARHTAKRSHVKLITHFSPNLFTTVTHATIVTTQPATALQPTMKPAFAAPFKKPRTTAELLDYAIQYADSPLEPEESPHRKRARKHRRAHAMAH